MTDNNRGLVKIRRALLSVSDKTGIVDFARELKRFGVEIISTGGTARVLRDAGIEVRDVSEVTGFPEMMDGRVKTLHPRIHGGLLGVRDNPDHQRAMREHEIPPIEMVVVNLYPFEQTVMQEGVTLRQAIEQIDIGGPAMIRSAAKNFNNVVVITGSEWYDRVLEEMNRNSGALSFPTRQSLALRAFQRTKQYDKAVGLYLLKQVLPTIDLLGEKESTEDKLGDDFDLFCTKLSDLRYGENPHQNAALYEVDEGDTDQAVTGIAHALLLSGKEMSFNNYVDADSAWQLVCDFDDLACTIIKHTNPAGAALGKTAEEAFRRALAGDPVSAFGGIVAFNCSVDEGAARAVIEIFTEVVIAPDYAEAALAVLSTKKNLRVLRATAKRAEGIEYKQISGGMLVQTRDAHRLSRDDLKIVTKRNPTEGEIRALLFAWTVCKHTKSNAIVYAREGQTIGVGAGQMSRIDSVKLGAMRAQRPIKGSVLASDAFFPFRDGIDEAAKHGITAVIQPGGSVRDPEVIAAADEHGLAMVFTGVRHFKH